MSAVPSIWGRVLAGAAAASTLASCGGGSSAETIPAPVVQPLSAAAAAGRALFHDKSLSASGKQSCATCHVQSRAFAADPANTADPMSPVIGRPPAFMPTPVNVPNDAEYGYYDLGLCGPFMPDPKDSGARPDLYRLIPTCGAFKVPTLRNIALTPPYFHNGVFSELHKAVQWYVTRDINNNTANNPAPVPAGPGGNPYQAIGTFYTNADGTPDLYRYNDLPAAFDANVNAGEAPYTAPAFAGGNGPTLNAQEIDDLVLFLCTLTDGYDLKNPSAYNVPAQCQPTASP